MLLAACLLCLTSCGSVRRYLAADEHILYKNRLDVQMADSSEVTPEVQDALKRVKNYYRQKPNSKVFGIDALRVGMTIYGWTSPKDSTIWGNYWRRMGQAPRIYDEGRATLTATQITSLLNAKGCFGSTVTFDTADIDDKDITICYHVSATPRYIVDEVYWRTSDETVARLLRQWEPDSPLKAGEYYDQDKIAAERARLVSALREEGYYHAAADNVTFLVDTTYDSRHLSIEVDVDSRNLQVYHINNVYIYPGGNTIATDKTDTLIHNYRGISRNIDYQFIYNEPMALHPQTISRAMMLFPGMTYRPRYISNTYNSLLSLRNFKYINIEFSESPSSTDSLPLVDAHVRLMRATQQKISFSVELTNASPLGGNDSVSFLSGGNLGVETAVEYLHKNLFGGAEQLKVKGSLLLELPKLIFRGSNGGFYDNFSSFESGLDASLDMPMFLLPFANGIAWQRTRPHTLISLGGSYQYRYYYERILANVSFGYTWRYGRNTQHQLLPIDLTFVRMLSVNSDFAARIASLNDLRLKYQYSNHFIFGARYDYAYSNQQFGTRRNFSVVHLSAESAGNLLSATAGLLGAEADSNGVMHILGSPYAQYVRLGGELTRYHYFGKRSTFVARAMIGLGLPYGNSVAMPYEKSFFGGGPTTMRAWQLRHLGPGSFQSGDNMLERVGDLQLVVNLEGRFPIVSILEGAVFTDMGNVWLLNPSEQYPGGNLNWSRVLDEIAIGIGVGLRLNVSVATLRVDFGIPLYDPGYDTSMRWRTTHWRFNQIVTNFGINYPF